MKCKNRNKKIIQTSLIMMFMIILMPCLSGSMADAREIVDMAGRHVEVPDVIKKVYGTSPPATFMVYAIEPGMLAGLNLSLDLLDKRYLDRRIYQLPVIGGQQGGSSPDLETMLKVQPDIILVWMWNRLSASNEKMERALKPFGIPIVYITMDSVTDYPDTFRFLGNLLNLKERADALCRYAEQTVKEVEKACSAIPEKDRVSVYYAEGADGLSTECHTSVHARLIPLSGGKNVHRCISSSPYGMQKISMEQVFKYDPEVIVSQEPLFLELIKTDAKWKNIRAVRDGRIYRIPCVPLNWFDRPPSFMRLLGLKWMTHSLYPEAYPIDIAAETRRFYKLFLNVSLDEAMSREILQQ
ncbi:MAG: ABC transporter substrate-binding protein [Desulfobacteraceae bacterium]